MLKDENNTPYFARLNPARLLKVVEETTFKRDYAARRTALPSRSVRVLSWNVARSNYSNSWIDDCRAIIDRYQPNLVFLQEVRLNAEKKEIPELMQLGWRFAPNFINAFNRSYSGVLTAAEASCSSSKALLTRHREPVVNTPKVSLFSEYALTGSSEPDSSQTLLAVNIHAINFVSLSKFESQLQEIEEILSRHQGAIVLAGDFNTWSQARWLAVQQMTARLNLTVVSFPIEEGEKLKRFLLSPPLDYIFYRGFHQKPFSARVIDTPSSSDHNPLLVELCG